MSEEQKELNLGEARKTVKEVMKAEIQRLEKRVRHLRKVLKRMTTDEEGEDDCERV